MSTPDEKRAARERRQECELRASFGGREVVFRDLELWWSDPEPPDQAHPTFSLVTSSDLPPQAPHLEIECAAPDATTFRDLVGEEFVLAPLSREDPRGWVSIDLGRDFKANGFAAREWVSPAAKLQFEALDGDALEGTFEASLERSAASGRAPAPAGVVRFEGRFRARAPKW